MVEDLDDMDAVERDRLLLKKECRSYWMLVKGRTPAPAEATAWKRWQRKAYDQHPCSEEEAVAAENNSVQCGLLGAGVCAFNSDTS